MAAASAGHCTTVARLLGVPDVELDARPDDWTREH
ncbi:hypothetical protein BTM25_51480 [Actinomadura rubteroloni]|uniref:Uncharacterized protein n=1 Tax=Actinomadura rubteroloni TaxID=1926885 RepID=A0A2P4UD33_9ACTN|nr:hypothetical protein BTM25_51480 [Actinomadura rubteroloni]